MIAGRMGGPSQAASERLMQNVEFKAELRDHNLAKSIALSIGGKFIEHLWQTDTYFQLADGRLKKRQTEGRPTEFIFYHRDNHTRPRISRFHIYSEAEAADRFGRIPVPEWVVVRKAREVYMWRGVRIHLDMVDRLGMFVEFEALVSPISNLVKCHAAIEELRQNFAAVLGEAVSASYSDMMVTEPELPPTGDPVG